MSETKRWYTLLLSIIESTRHETTTTEIQHKFKEVALRFHQEFSTCTKNYSICCAVQIRENESKATVEKSFRHFIMDTFICS